MCLVPLGSAGGFSGARFWRLTAARGELVLRRWPRPHPNVQRLQFIHEVLYRVTENGFGLVPQPIRTTDGVTFVSQSGHLWELSHWMPGAANYHQQPSNQKLIAAMAALANFHTAARFRSHDHPSPGISERSEMLQQLMGGEARQISEAVAVDNHGWPELSTRGLAVMQLFHRVVGETVRSLDRCRNQSVPLQPCLRDVWHDHILFQGDAVSGMIDFGAMRTDNVATDIARLLGSLTRGNSKQWFRGLEAYRRVRSLSKLELKLVDAFDRSTITLSGINWLRWIYLEGRQFDQRTEIQIRIDKIIHRMETLIQASRLDV